MKKIKLSVKAVIFDMDGVITNTMPDHYHAWKTVLHKAGVPVNHLDVYKREGQKGLMSVEEIFSEYGRFFDPSSAAKLLAEKETLFKKIVKIRFIPGARRFIQNLFSRRFRLALVTGTSRHEMKRILPDGLQKKFDTIVTGCDVHNGKPHPEPFRKALKAMGLKPQEAVVIENAPLGIASAQKAGLRCLAIATSLPKPYLKEADWIFSSISDLSFRTDFQLKQQNI